MLQKHLGQGQGLSIVRLAKTVRTHFVPSLGLVTLGWDLEKQM